MAPQVARGHLVADHTLGIKANTQASVSESRVGRGRKKKRREIFYFIFSESVVWVADRHPIKGPFDSSLCGNIIMSVNPDRLSPRVSLDSRFAIDFLSACPECRRCLCWLCGLMINGPSCGRIILSHLRVEPASVGESWRRLNSVPLEQGERHLTLSPRNV